MDCWVGNTEKNIAKTFRDLNIKKELLIIDEIDSFLFDRSTAIRSWENVTGRYVAYCNIKSHQIQLSLTANRFA